MKNMKTFTSKDNTKSSVIVLNNDEVFVVQFYENNKRVGEIEYPNKSYYYVEDAAYNYIEGILTKETINYYKKA